MEVWRNFSLIPGIKYNPLVFLYSKYHDNSYRYKKSVGIVPKPGGSGQMHPAPWVTSAKLNIRKVCALITTMSELINHISCLCDCFMEHVWKTETLATQLWHLLIILRVCQLTYFVHNSCVVTHLVTSPTELPNSVSLNNITILLFNCKQNILLSSCLELSSWNNS
jgi:hypothetical protein